MIIAFSMAQKANASDASLLILFRLMASVPKSMMVVSILGTKANAFSVDSVGLLITAFARE